MNFIYDAIKWIFSGVGVDVFRKKDDKKATNKT